jgi:hypothetical protein
MRVLSCVLLLCCIALSGCKGGRSLIPQADAERLETLVNFSFALQGNYQELVEPGNDDEKVLGMILAYNKNAKPMNAGAIGNDCLKKRIQSLVDSMK